MIGNLSHRIQCEWWPLELCYMKALVNAVGAKESNSRYILNLKLTRFIVRLPMEGFARE